jgi:hypothetical protein
MNKMIAEKMAVEVSNTEDVIEAKQAAFAAALAEIAHLAPNNKKK